MGNSLFNLLGFKSSLPTLTPAQVRLEACVREAFQEMDESPQIALIDLRSDPLTGHEDLAHCTEVYSHAQKLADAHSCALLYQATDPNRVLMGARVISTGGFMHTNPGFNPILAQTHESPLASEELPFAILLSAYSFCNGKLLPPSEFSLGKFQVGVSANLAAGGNHSPFCYLVRTPTLKKPSVELICIGTPEFNAFFNAERTGSTFLGEDLPHKKIVHKAIDPFLNGVGEVYSSSSPVYPAREYVNARP